MINKNEKTDFNYLKEISRLIDIINQLKEENKEKYCTEEGLDEGFKRFLKETCLDSQESSIITVMRSAYARGAGQGFYDGKIAARTENCGTYGNGNELVVANTKLDLCQNALLSNSEYCKIIKEKLVDCELQLADMRISYVKSASDVEGMKSSRDRAIFECGSLKSQLQHVKSQLIYVENESEKTKTNHS